MNSKKEKEKDTKEIVFWRSLGGGGVLFGVGVLLLIYVVPLLAHESIQLIVTRGIAEALLIAGVFHVFYEIGIRRKFKNEIAITVSEAVNADVDFLKEKLKGNVDSIIKNCLQAKLCNAELASIFFDGLISPYISIEKFKKKFIYDITLNSLDHDIEADSIVLKRTAYFKVVEELTYKKKLSVKKGAKFMIGLCLNDPQLEYYKSRHCIYRTILRIRESDSKVLQMTPLPINIFKITVRINDEEVITKINPFDENKGIEISCRYEGDEITTNEDTEFYIRVATVHDKEINYYTAYLYDPSFSPAIKLHYNNEIKDIFAITQFTTGKGKDVVPENDEDAKHILVEGKDEWVFPTSGIVFIWKLTRIESAAILKKQGFEQLGT